MGRQKWRTRSLSEQFRALKLVPFMRLHRVLAQDVLVCADHVFLKDHGILEQLGLEGTLKVANPLPWSLSLL